jgi:hypothetical protein
LLLVLLLGYAFGLPGEALMPGFGDFSPSLEGTLHGGLQALRLLILLLWLDILVLALPAEHLLGGLYQVMAPFALLGLDRGRAALRLGLTLQAIEGLERGRGNLSRLLEQDDRGALPERIHVRVRPAHGLDLVVPLALLAGVLGLWLNA